MIFAPIAHIQAEVAQFYHLPLRVITSRDQTQATSRARHVAMLLTRELLGKSKAEIGRRFKRDKATVSQAIERLEKRIGANPVLAAEVEALRESLAP